jgi:hypothetical protein
MMRLIGKENVDGRHEAGHDDEAVATVTSRARMGPIPGVTFSTIAIMS